MFKQIAGIIYTIWLIGMLLFVAFVWYRSRLRDRHEFELRQKIVDV